MTRAPFWSAVLLAAMAAGSGCGAPPVTVGTDVRHPTSKPARLFGEAQVAPAPADSGLILQQGNSVVDLSMPSGGSVSLNQANQLVLQLVDDPLELLEHYVELPNQLVWDLTTRSFFIAQVNHTASASGTYYRQANDLLVIVDHAATSYSGTIAQSNGIDHFDVAGQAVIDQLNTMTVVQGGEGGMEADDFVALMQSGPEGTHLTLTTAALLDKSPRLIIFIDSIGRPHLYQWQAPVGKHGLDALRRKG